MKQTERKYKAKFLLLGFNSTVKKIQLSEEIIIRKGDKKELKEMYDQFKVNSELNQQYVLEFEYVSSSSGTMSNESYELMDKFNSFFQIFTNGTVKTAHFIWYCLLNDEFKSLGYSTNNKVSTYFSEEYKLTLKESKVLISRWNSFMNQRDKKAFQIAIRRLLFSTQKYELEDRLIDLMIAFEATYLDASEKGEIAYKLALRTSYLLRNHFNRQQVFEFMKKGYSLRSSIVHGANLKGNEITFNGRKLNLESVVVTLLSLIRTTFEIIICEHPDSTTKELIDSLDLRISSGIEK